MDAETLLTVVKVVTPVVLTVVLAVLVARDR